MRRTRTREHSMIRASNCAVGVPLAHPKACFKRPRAFKHTCLANHRTSLEEGIVQLSLIGTIVIGWMRN